MKLTTNHYYAIFFGIIVIGGLVAINLPKEVESGQYDELAQCIADSGATFYGAYWCPACGQQKTIFGSAEQYLPYVECSTPNGQDQTQICIDAGIESYPTWELADGTRLGGVQQPEDLATATNCPLPGETIATESEPVDTAEESGVSETLEFADPDATTEVVDTDSTAAESEAQ